MIVVLISILIFIGSSPGQPDPKSDKVLTIVEKTKGMKKYPGYFDYYWEEGTGKIWLEIKRLEVEFLYVNYLSQGVGSNDIGLDRGQIGGNRIVKIQRIGPKVLLIEPNYSFRAVSDNPEEQKAVKESFAESVLWGFQVAAEEKGKILVDATDFLIRDAHDVMGTLKRTKQGDYQLDGNRSAIYLERTKNFPKNSEIDAILTFTGNSAGDWIESVVPTSRSVTVHQHHSFIELPDNKFKPRRLDVRSGFFGISYMDYATPIDKPIVKRFIARHRLKKKDPNSQVSEPINPIIYYVDPGAPEPIQSALIDGAKWWNEAFEAIGYKNAFQVKILPEDADPLDIRYNVIQWVHRSTRGWSYGSAIIDPRTGEIIKGHVSLGSLRVRQDFLIAEGLLAPYEEGKPVSSAMQEMALARLRQLSAHEVGHTLGLSHNFSASTSNRASVMDYPYPFAKIDKDGSIDLSEAYDTEIGEWDKVTIAYGYQDFQPGTDEKKVLEDILRKSISEGLIYISDTDARPAGGAHPLAHLWDNGSNASAELDRVMELRKQVLNRFSVNNIPQGTPMATLEEVLVPMYMYHRYQLEAAVKLLGGLYYTYAVRGDGQEVVKMIPGNDQRQALESLLRTIKPQALALPERILNIIPPRPEGYYRNRELFNIKTRVTFDPLSAAESAANLTIQLILQPERAARLIEFNARDNNLPSLGEVIDDLISSTWKTSPQSKYFQEIQRVVDNVVLFHLMSLAVSDKTTGQARAIAYLKIKKLKKWLNKQISKTKDETQQVHYLYAVSQIEQFQKDPDQFKPFAPVEPPAGSPIGSTGFNFYTFDCGLQ
jgi:hypothetical protein